MFINLSDALSHSTHRYLQKQRCNDLGFCQVEKDPEAVSTVRRSSRARKGRPDYKALWEEGAVGTWLRKGVSPIILGTLWRPAGHAHS